MDMMDAYGRLLEEFGRKEWWHTERGFRPKEWEICLGAILTQNTNWRNVEKALENLRKENILAPENIIGLEQKRLEALVRPSGFYRQKAERLKTLAEFALKFGNFKNFKTKVTREELLSIKGIGPETADSILLYACGRPHFVIDSYTKRFVKSLGIKTKDDYESLRECFESNLPRDPEVYKEFHALIVQWGKRSPPPQLK